MLSSNIKPLDMDVLWSKEKLYKIFSKDSLPIAAAQASGDGGSNYFCRLCGGDNSLHRLCDTHLRDGVEQTYYQLLYDCFGLQVEHAEGMICERCVHQLHSTQRFRSLVEAAFAVPSELGTTSKMESEEYFIKKKDKSNVELSKKVTKSKIDNKRKHPRRSIFNLNVQQKRTIISCSLCRQRYPMLVPFVGWKNFICSRCKKNCIPQPNVIRKADFPTNNAREQSNLLVKSRTRGQSRLLTLPKRSSQISRNELGTSKCQLRPTKYVSQTITHRPNRKNVLDYCCSVCGRDMKTRELLDRHMRSHTGQPIYRCDVCMRVFKMKSTFQKHYLSHGK